MMFVYIVLLSLIAAAVQGAAVSSNEDAVQSSYKARRGGTVGLFPFPRVGRAQFGKSWQVVPEEFAELHSDTKRQGLIPFPRVGRSMSLEPQVALGTRWGANGDAGGGMWFGPRLGRLSKRNGLSALNDPWTMIALRELHSDTKRQGLIPFPRVGRSMSLEPQVALGTRWGANGDAGGGMWFGPRLGRLSKRNGLSALNDPWTMIALREFASQRDFTPRLGRESEEADADDLDQDPNEQDAARIV